MKGVHVEYKRLGALLREGRERKRMTIGVAAMAIGLTNGSYLARCERGSSNFPAGKLKEALKIYRIPAATAVTAASEDFVDSISGYLRGK